MHRCARHPDADFRSVCSISQSRTARQNMHHGRAQRHLRNAIVGTAFEPVWCAAPTSPRHSHRASRRK
eukprot:7310882-Prymnesium_polylepis.1